MNGTADPLVPYDGGQVRVFEQDRGRVLSTEETIAWWAAHDGCTGPPTVHRVPDRDPEDGMRIVVERHEACAAGTEVSRVRVEGGGHTWPGGHQYLPVSLVGPVARDAQGADLVFRFFDRHVDDRAQDARLSPRPPPPDGPARPR